MSRKILKILTVDDLRGRLGQFTFSTAFAVDQALQNGARVLGGSDHGDGDWSVSLWHVTLEDARRLVRLGAMGYTFEDVHYIEILGPEYGLHGDS